MLLATLLSALAPAPAFCQDPGPNNILVVLLDDVGVDMVGCYAEGPDPAPTPVLDSLAAEGVLFRNAWANPVCSPSRGELLTGRYGYRTGLGRIVTPAGWALHLDEVTIPERLLESPYDYRSGAFGKWHLSNDVVGGGDLGPNLQGFQHFVGTWGNIDMPYDYENYAQLENGVTTQVTGYATSRTVDDALAWIQSSSEPWFAYVAFHAPHSPYHAPPDELHNLQDQIAGLDPRRVPRPFYKAMIEAADMELGRLLGGLGDQLPNTQIVVVADNGTPKECSMAPFVPEHAKLTPYEGGVNVPMIIAGPDVQAPGSEVAALVCITDIFETVLEWSQMDLAEGAGPTGPVDSVSLVPYLQDPEHTPLRDVVYADYFTPNDPAGFGITVTMRMIRGERYKLIERVQPPNPPQLFDLLEDPFETNNLLGPPVIDYKYGLIAIELGQRLAAILAGTENP